MRWRVGVNGDTPPVFVAVAISCASERKLFFFSEEGGVGLGKGAVA